MIHATVWTGARNAKIVDMTNANKRGKRCQVFHFRGVLDSLTTDEPMKKAAQFSINILSDIQELPANSDFAQVTDSLRDRIVGANHQLVECYFDEIKSIDAPKTKLTAEGEGWAASADETGLHIQDTKDLNNEPTMITPHNQSNAEAYRLAAKVWDMVKTAKSFHEVGNILRTAGCRLHYYCAVD